MNFDVLQQIYKKIMVWPVDNKILTNFPKAATFTTRKKWLSLAVTKWKTALVRGWQWLLSGGVYQPSFREVQNKAFNEICSPRVSPVREHYEKLKTLPFLRSCMNRSLHSWRFSWYNMQKQGNEALAPLPLVLTTFVTQSRTLTPTKPPGYTG